MDSGGKDIKYISKLVDIDLTKLLLRGTKLRYKSSETWVEFKYEQSHVFYFYCGTIGHNERLCLKRMKDVEQNCVLSEQFGGWLRANNRRSDI